MKLPEMTQKDAEENGDIETTHAKELARNVIECFENLLKERGINLDDPDAPETVEERIKEGIGPLYGSTYYSLVSEVQDTIENYLEPLDPDAKFYARKRWAIGDAIDRAKDRFGVELTLDEADEAMRNCAKALGECSEQDWMCIDYGIEEVESVVPRIEAQRTEPFLLRCCNCNREFNLTNSYGSCPYCNDTDIEKLDD